MTLPAGKDADLTLTLTRTTAGPGPTSLGVTIGDRSITIPVTGTDDLVRGAAMTHSSTIGARSSAENLNDGRIDTGVWGPGGTGAWNDGTAKAFPDWVQGSWTEPVRLGKVVVYTLDRPTDPASGVGVKDYDVQIKTGQGDWKSVAQVRDNKQGIITSTFPAVTASALRILISDSNDHTYSRLISVQAFRS